MYIDSLLYYPPPGLFTLVAPAKLYVVTRVNKPGGRRVIVMVEDFCGLHTKPNIALTAGIAS